MNHGKGTRYYVNGNRNYVGQWKNGKFNSQGTTFRANGSKEYEG